MSLTVLSRTVRRHAVLISLSAAFASVAVMFAAPAGAAAEAKPVAITENASLIGGKTAKLNASINPQGLATSYLFIVTDFASYNQVVPTPPEDVGAGSVSVPTQELADGLELSTTYYFRVVAWNAKGTTYGDLEEFTTAAATPVFAGSFGGLGEGNGEFDHPHGVAVAPDGNIWVADTYNYRVQQFSAAGDYLGQFGEVGSEAGQFSYPTDVDVDHEGNVFVADANYHIQKFNANGEYVDEIGEYGNEDGQLELPWGIAFDHEGDIWATDASLARVQQFNAAGEYLSQFGEYGDEDGQLSAPFDLAFDSEGDVWVADSASGRVQQFNAAGEYLSQFGKSGLGGGNGEFGETAGVAIDSDDNVWVTDDGASSVQRFDQEGNYLGRLGEKGSGAGQVLTPHGIAISGGDIWLADMGNHRIQHWIR